MLRFYSLLIFTAFLFSGAQLSAIAIDACETNISANESGAKVFVNDQYVGSTPLRLACAKALRTVKVKSNSGEEFVRVLADQKNMAPSDAWLNVHFANVKQEGLTNLAAHSGSRSMAIGGSTNESRIVQELIEIRKLLEKLTGQNPSVGANVRQLAESAVRSVNSVTAGSAVDPQIMRGAYLQLHSLARKEFDRPRIKRQVATYKEVLGEKSVHLCKWQKNPEEIDWTRVLVGPFQSIATAREAAKIVGGTSYMVTNPGCARKP